MEIISKYKKLLFIIGAMIIFVIYIMFSVLLFQGTTPEEGPQQVTPEAEETTEEQREPGLRYDPKAEEEILKKVAERPTLPPTDLSVRRRLITTLGNQSGILYETDVARLEYVRAPDVFMAEIFTPQIAFAKKQIVDWLRDQGLSNEGICNLPLIFYMNKEVIENLKGTQKRDYVFNSLPDECT